jgi:hypothetical protein
MNRNRHMKRITAVTFVSCAYLAFSNAAGAQTNAAFELTRISLTSAKQYVATEAIPRQISIPPNLIVSDEFRPLVESMLAHSPTFRRQCVRISSDPKVTVQLQVGLPTWLSGVRAKTDLKRAPGGHLSAFIEISPLQDNVEMIAHELEHVIEQLDEIDLEARSAFRNSGVWRASGATSVFETTRAKHVGVVVTKEFRTNRGT